MNPLIKLQQNYPPRTQLAEGSGECTILNPHLCTLQKKRRVSLGIRNTYLKCKPTCHSPDLLAPISECQTLRAIVGCQSMKSVEAEKLDIWHFSILKYLTDPVTFNEKIILCPLHCSVIFVTDYNEGLLQDSLLFHRSICLFLCQKHTGLIN
ncbi:uncharacterized protein LOC144320501 [Canis aureus]